MANNVTSSLCSRRAVRSPSIHAAKRLSPPCGPSSSDSSSPQGLPPALLLGQAPLCQGVGHEPEAIAGLPAAVGPEPAPMEDLFRRHARARPARGVVELLRVFQGKGAEQSAAAGVKQAGVAHGQGLPLVAERLSRRGQSARRPGRRRRPLAAPTAGRDRADLRPRTSASHSPWIAESEVGPRFHAAAGTAHEVVDQQRGPEAGKASFGGAVGHGVAARRIVGRRRRPRTPPGCCRVEATRRYAQVTAMMPTDYLRRRLGCRCPGT